MTSILSRRNSPRDDEGSLLLVILFTIIMSALVVVATVTAMTGLEKTKNSRDYAISLQAADTAFADALMYANLDKFPTNNNGTITHSGTVSNVNWQWTAKRTAPRTYDVTVSATGKRLDRNFTATIRGTSVENGIKNNSTGQIRYLVSEADYYEQGFFGIGAVTMTGAPDVDGYNSASGIVGSNGNLVLGDAQVDQINLWQWTQDTNRCTPSTSCNPNLFKRYAQPAYFNDEFIRRNCTNNLGAWRASTSGNLVSGGCYSSLLFDTTYDARATDPIYVTGAVTVRANVQVNTLSSQTNASSAGLRINALGSFTQAANSKVAMAVYTMNGTCNINPQAGDTRFKTVFLGALVCQDLRVDGSARLRYDGGLGLVGNANENGPTIWGLYDYESIN